MDLFSPVILRTLSPVCASCCRCGNEELLQEDGLRAGGTVHGEGPARAGDGLKMILLIKAALWDMNINVMVFRGIRDAGWFLLTARASAFIWSARGCCISSVL